MLYTVSQERHCFDTIFIYLLTYLLTYLLAYLLRRYTNRPYFTFTVTLLYDAVPTYQSDGH